MKPSISRRSLLIGLGGGLAATSIVWTLGGFDVWLDERRASPDPARTTYVDHEGWLLTVDDKKKLLSTATIKHLDNTNLPGSDIDSRVVTDLEACTLWCVTEPECRSFAFARTVSGRGRPNTCWIKDSVPEAVPLEGYASGILE